MSEKVKVVEEKEVKTVKEIEIKIDTSKMNVFSKLQSVRAVLSKTNLKRSGLNKFSGFSYFELGDFIGQINELCLKYGLFTYADITPEFGRITAVNIDNPEETFTLTMPLAEVEVKSMPLIQARGALLTYARRYLYMLLFEIAESDTLDAIVDKDDKSTKAKKSAKPVENDKKTQMKQLCTSLSAGGHKEAVSDILTTHAKVKNPNSITDEVIMDKIIKDLEALK